MIRGEGRHGRERRERKKDIKVRGVDGVCEGEKIFSSHEKEGGIKGGVERESNTFHRRKTKGENKGKGGREVSFKGREEEE